jgi:hypothetical protein
MLITFGKENGCEMAGLYNDESSSSSSAAALQPTMGLGLPQNIPPRLSIPGS